MKNLFFYLILMVIVLGGNSCNDMYDNVNEFATSETIYPGKYDMATATIGYERVEIDLLNAGRIPASEVHLGKAKKTVVEYDDKVITIDSLCSYVNISGLTQSRLYRFRIYTADNYGNKSVPVEVATVPYTIDDLNALNVPIPRIISTPRTATIDWPSGLSSLLFDYYDLSYSYTDKTGLLIAGQCGADAQIVVENQEPGANVNVLVKYRIIPKKEDVPILDTVLLERPITFTLPTIDS
jgi:hypothetical protein